MEVHVVKIVEILNSGCKCLMSLQVWPPRQDSGSQRRWPSSRTWFLIRHLKRPSNPRSQERKLCCVSWNRLMAPTLIRSMEQAPTHLYLQPTIPVPTTSSRGQCDIIYTPILVTRFVLRKEGFSSLKFSISKMGNTSTNFLKKICINCMLQLVIQR